MTTQAVVFQQAMILAIAKILASCSMNAMVVQHRLDAKLLAEATILVSGIMNAMVVQSRLETKLLPKSH